jgi:hypothetical protein
VQIGPYHVSACVSIARDVALGNDLHCIFPVIIQDSRGASAAMVQYYALASDPQDVDGIYYRSVWHEANE